MFSTRRPASRTTANASGLQIGRRLALGQPLAEFGRLGAKLLVRERLQGRLERVDLVDERAQPFQFALVLGSDDFCEESTQHGESFRGYSDNSNTNLSADRGADWGRQQSRACPARTISRPEVRRLRGFAGQQLQRVDQLPVGEHFVVEMRPRRPAGGTDVTDDVTALDRRALPDRELGEVAVPRHQAESVVDDDEVAVVAARRRQLDLAGRRREDRCSFFGRNIEPRVKISIACERIRAHAVTGREPSMDRPDRRRRIHQRLAFFDVSADGAEMSLEAAEHVAQHREGLIERRH